MKKILIVGDVLAIAVLTIIGFASHSETDSSYLPRAAALFFPMLICWFLLAPSIGLFDLQQINMPKNLWRVVYAGVFAIPLAAVIRSALLNTAILPVFVFVMIAVNSAGFLLWRGLFLLYLRKKSA